MAFGSVAWAGGNIHPDGTSERGRYFIPMLPPIAYFASRQLPNKRAQIIALILIAVAGLSVMSYAITYHAPNPCFHHTGIARASQGLDGIICSTHWTITAYYSHQSVEKMWYGRNYMECIENASWLIYAPNNNPSINNSILNNNPWLHFISSFGPNCSKAFLYKITKK